MKNISLIAIIIQTTRLLAKHFSAAACFLVVTALHAQTTEIWDNGSGNFSWDTTSLNWSGSAWADGNNASFGATGNDAITVIGTRTILNLTLSSTNYTFNGGTLNATNDGTFANIWSFTGTPSLKCCTNNSALTATLTGSASSTLGTFEKTGAGTLYQNGPVTMTADTNNFYGSYWHVWASAFAYVILSGDCNFTNVLLMPGVSAGTSGNVAIIGGTDVFTGSTNLSKRGLAVNGNARLVIGGGNITTDRLVVGNGGGATYLQTNGTVFVTDTLGAGVSQQVGVELGEGAIAGQKAYLYLNGGKLIALGIGSPASYNWASMSTIYLNGGTFQCAGDSTNLFSTDVPTSAAGSILIGVSTNGPAPLTNGATIDTAGFSVTQVQPLLAGTPSGGLTKLGAGKLDLAGVNTYTGATTVSDGSLLVDGSLAAGSVVEVALGGTLGGSGTINGPVTVDAGGAVAPGGATVDVLTINNDLTLNASAAAVFRLNTANGLVINDSLVVTGTQSITGSTLNVVNVGPPLHVGDSFTLLSQATSGFTTVNLPAGYTWANHLASDGSVQVLTVVSPSPTSITYSVSGNQMELNWPSGQGWQLQMQTNDMATGLTTNWLNVLGATPPYTNIIDPANPAVFYRLVGP